MKNLTFSNQYLFNNNFFITLMDQLISSEGNRVQKTVPVCPADADLTHSFHNLLLFFSGFTQKNSTLISSLPWWTSYSHQRVIGYRRTEDCPTDADSNLSTISYLLLFFSGFTQLFWWKDLPISRAAVLQVFRSLSDNNLLLVLFVIRATCLMVLLSFIISITSLIPTLLYLVKKGKVAILLFR